MADNIVRREVQRRDDPFGIPACFYWTIDEVADWIESIGYAKYKENFRSHFINGRKLLTVDACVLPKMGITHFGDILSICLQARELSSIRRVPFSPYVDTTHVYLFHHDIRPDPTGPPKELAGYIRDLIGKGSKATWLPPLPGPKFHGGPQRFQLEACHGNDIDYNWRYSVPEFHFGYMPKRHPVTVADFHVRWLNNSQQACKLLGRHLFDLHRPA